MYEKLKGIVLNTIRYSDKHNIVHVYTDGRGLMSFAVPQGKTQAARMRNAMLMPLSLVDLEAGVRNGREVAVMRELRRNYPLATIYSDPIKNAIALFISELLAHVIQEMTRCSVTLSRPCSCWSRCLTIMPISTSASFTTWALTWVSSLMWRATTAAIGLT